MTCKRNQKYLEKFATREVNARIIEDQYKLHMDT